MANARPATSTPGTVLDPDSERVVEARRKAAQAAEESAKAKAEAALKAEAELKAAKEAKAEADRQADRQRLEAARKSLRLASPENPVALRRLECVSEVGDTLYGGSPRRAIDLKNSEYAAVTLLYDGQVVHVINGRDSSKSFWVGPANIAAIYPRLDL